MAATNRTDKVKLLVKTLQKRYKHIPKPTTRNLLECLMYAACLENATFDAAESAYSVLEHHYIDWNELRVSTPQEIADTLPMLPQPLEAGERIKKTLQWVFETTYMFDLEDYRKKTIGQTVEYLESIPSCTPFMTGYLVQIGLGGHQIPIDEAALRILRRLDLTKVNNGREEVPGLERIVTKSKSIEFTTLMHLFGMEFFNRQDDEELLALLRSIDKNAAKRSWREPEGVLKKTDAKPPVPARVVSPRASAFKPEIDLDEDEGEPLGHVSKEESVEFIETDLAALGAGGKDSEDRASDASSLKRKKPSSHKTESKKKSSEPTAIPKPETVILSRETTPEIAPKTGTKAELSKKDETGGKKVDSSDEKPDDQVASGTKPAKTTKEKPAPVTHPPETKKTTLQKKDTKTPPKAPKTTAKKDQKKTEPKTPQKPPKPAPEKSATKKLQQKKPR